jgi:DNA replication protein DnaC
VDQQPLAPWVSQEGPSLNGSAKERLISRRYERGSVILTSNKAFSEWGSVFADDILATAILDRLLHHCHVIPINQGFRS